MLPDSPAGNCDWICGNTLRTRAITSSTLASGAALMPIATVCCPSNENSEL